MNLECKCIYLHLHVMNTLKYAYKFELSCLLHSSLAPSVLLYILNLVAPDLQRATCGATNCLQDSHLSQQYTFRLLFQFHWPLECSKVTRKWPWNLCSLHGNHWILFLSLISYVIYKCHLQYKKKHLGHKCVHV